MKLGIDEVLKVPHKIFVVFRPDQPRCGWRAGKNRSGVPLQKTSSLNRKTTATNRMHSNDLFSSKKVLHHSLLFLCIFNFKYLKNSGKWSDQAKIFKDIALCPLLLFLKKTSSFEKRICFCSKTTFLTQKCKITVIVCFDNVFTIIV